MTLAFAVADETKSGREKLATLLRIQNPHFHLCVIPGLLNDTYKIQGQWHAELENRSIPYLQDDKEYSECEVYRYTNGVGFSTNVTESCHAWVYDRSTFDRTVVTDLNLVCGDKMLRTYANMILMGGLLVGSLVLGSLSDVIGRKKVLLIGVAGHFGSSLGVTFVTSYEAFVILRFSTTFFGIGMFLSAFVIGMELVGPSKRKYAGIVIEIFWCIGLFIQNGVAYGLRDWRYLQAALSAPTVLFLSYWWLLPESPRWLINKGKLKEAEIVIKKAAKGNGVELSKKALRLDELEVEGEGERIWHMFTTPVLLIRSLVIFFNWLVASMVYYGLSLNVGGLSGNIYLNFFISAVAELASYIFCLLLLDVTGRKPLQCISMLVGGVACIATMAPVITDAPEWITMVLSMVGKFGASAAFAVIYVFSAELFPTVMRNSGMGLSSFSARIGGVVAPYIADLGDMVDGHFGVALPLIIFGGASVLAGLLALLLPETLDRKLPDTVEDAKNFAKQKKASAYVLDNMAEEKDSSNGKYNQAFTPDGSY
ncbi:organic cation transporter protein [Aplysia californica]|uniref:Organic cation transporter protein n=1 Tax=Aplysia californica TaxID=6500 RepID=A0ABM0JP50_APLCA|nr:organic cation transporter protein [Aplysia californica]